MAVSNTTRDGIYVIPLLSTQNRVGVLIALALFSAVAMCASPSQIQRMVEQGDNQQALAASDDYLSGNQNDAEVRFQRGLALAGLGRADAAIDAFGELARENPQVPEYANNLAVLYAQKGDYEKARRWLEAAMSTHPAYATAHRNLGDVYTALAAVAYSKALDEDGQPTDLGVQLELVNELHEAPGGTQLAQASQPSKPRIVPAPAPKPEPARPPVQPEPKPKPKPPQPAPQPAPVPEPQPVPQPAPAPEAPVTSPEPSTSPAVAQRGILQTVRDWAQAWSNQDVQAYLNSYADNFYPGDDQTLPQWREERRVRVGKPGNISVQVIEPKVELEEDGRARVTFRQAYDADNYSDEVRKTLILERKGQGWRIVREISNPL